MSKMLVTVVVLGCMCILAGACPNSAFGQAKIIQLEETLQLDQETDFAVYPRSFGVTEDGLFLISDLRSATIKVLTRSESGLKFVAEIGPRFGNEKFVRPKYCFYNPRDQKLGVLDFGSRRIFVFDRPGKIDFRMIKSVSCPAMGNDIEFAGQYGEQLVVSGYLADKKDDNRPYELYELNIRNDEIKYLLPSEAKYGCKDIDAFRDAYLIKETLPAVGIRAYIDIWEDKLFFVWEGDLRILAIDLKKDKPKPEPFAHYLNDELYSPPDRDELAKIRRRGDFEGTFNERIKMTYIRNIFATGRYVFLIYELGTNTQGQSKFRLQVYTTDGLFVDSASIPNIPGREMFLDKENHDLYALKKTENGKGKFTILKYRINVDSIDNLVGRK